MAYKNNSKKMVGTLLTGVMLLALLTACGGHTHRAANGWIGDLKYHWQMCECGEKLDYGAHALDNDWCTVCGGEVFVFEEGGGQFATYNENGDQLCCLTYAADGTMEFAFAYEYGDGRMTETEYAADRLSAKREFAMDAEGNQVLVGDIAYNEDGSYTVYQYDLRGNETLEGSYAADGKAESEVRYENEYDAAGNRTLRRTFVGDVLTEEMEFLFGSDEEGSWSMSGKTTTYHADGSKTVKDGDYENNLWGAEVTYAADGTVLEELRYTYEYDEQGESVASKGYKNGKLFRESAAVKNADGESIGFTITDYAEDGSKTVREYNDKLDEVKKTTYDAAGNVVEQSA